MLSYKIFDIYLPRNKCCDVFLTQCQSRGRGLIFKAKMTKDTNRDEVCLTSNPESSQSKLHYTLNCVSQQNGDLCRERMFFRESRSNASFSVNSLFLFYLLCLVQSFPSSQFPPQFEVLRHRRNACYAGFFSYHVLHLLSRTCVYNDNDNIIRMIK